MQKQIAAIKQLLETNNAIASVIESVLIEVIGDRASWENASLIQELQDVVNWGDIEYKDVSIPVLQQLWRSRIVLNNARINADEVDLEEFLASLAEEQKQVKASLLDFLSGDEPIEITSATTRIPRAHEIIAERDREISLLKTTIKGFEAIANLKTQDSDIKLLSGDVKDLCDRLRTSANQISERNTQIEELQISLKNHREQFDNLKSHFEVLLKAIAMNLNALKGERKPDRVAEEVKKLKGVTLKDFSFDEIPF